MAVTASTAQLRATFLDLSKNWEKLAIQLENAFAQLAESEDNRLKVRESVEEARRLRKNSRYSDSTFGNPGGARRASRTGPLNAWADNRL